MGLQGWIVWCDVYEFSLEALVEFEMKEIKRMCDGHVVVMAWGHRCQQSKNFHFSSGVFHVPEGLVRSPC